jgi:hypothetical protein
VIGAAIINTIDTHGDWSENAGGNRRDSIEKLPCRMRLKIGGNDIEPDNLRGGVV